MSLNRDKLKGSQCPQRSIPGFCFHCLALWQCFVVQDQEGYDNCLCKVWHSREPGRGLKAWQGRAGAVVQKGLLRGLLSASQRCLSPRRLAAPPTQRKAGRRSFVTQLSRGLGARNSQPAPLRAAGGLQPDPSTPAVFCYVF